MYVLYWTTKNDLKFSSSKYIWYYETPETQKCILQITFFCKTNLIWISVHFYCTYLDVDSIKIQWMCVYMTYDTVKQTRTITCIGLLLTTLIFSWFFFDVDACYSCNTKAKIIIFSHTTSRYIQKDSKEKSLLFVQISINHVYKVLVYSDAYIYTREYVTGKYKNFE